MDSLNQLDLNDIISHEQYTYSVSNIEDKRDKYTPGNTVQISFPPGNYIKDCRQDYLIFDSEFSEGNSVAGAYYPRQPEDFFQINNLEINGIQLMQSTMSQGKNLFTNWLKNSLTPYKPQDLTLPLSSLKLSNTAAVGTGVLNNATGLQAQVLSFEPSNQVNSSIMAYDMAQLSASKYRQKQYNLTLTTTTGVVASTAGTEFTANMIRIGDICPEYDSLALVNMCSTSIRMTIRFNDVNRVITTGAQGAVLADNTYTVLGAETYSLSNLCLYFKTLQIKPNLIAQAKMMMNKSRPILTIYQNIKPLEGAVTNQRISVNTSNLYYVIVFLQPNANDKKQGAAAAINYDTNTDLATFQGQFNSLRYGTYEDSLEFKYNQLVVDIGGKQFKQQIIPVGKRDLKAFIDASNSVYQCTGQYLNITLTQFLNNRFFSIIALSPNQFPDTIHQDGSIVLNIMLDLAGTDKRLAGFDNSTAMQMVTFVVGSKILINGERLE